MKRQKRDRTNRAFVKGYYAGVSGRSKESCPFNEVASRQTWLSGWREGRTDQWEGYTGVSGIHKIANL
jgi:ribosome modulation factor